jgi:hypothetical protein
MDFTVFTDESGGFSNPDGPLGKHVTVALVVPGRRGDVEARIVRSLKHAGPDLPSPFHATETLHPPAVAAELQRQIAAGAAACRPELADALRDTAPNGVATWPSSPALRPRWDELKRTGARWLSAARGVASALVEEGGRVVLCLQHGNAPEPGQWGRMMFAVLDEALLSIALDASTSEHRVELGLADRGGRLPFDLAPTLDLLDRVRASGTALAQLACPRSAPTEDAEGSPGIQMADVIAHAFGPGPAMYQSVTAAQATALDWAALRREARTWMSVRATGPLHPGGARDETHGRVMTALAEAAEGRQILAEPLGVLRADRTRLPPFTYCCSVEGTLKLVQHFANPKCKASTRS